MRTMDGIGTRMVIWEYIREDMIGIPALHADNPPFFPRSSPISPPLLKSHSEQNATSNNFANSWSKLGELCEVFSQEECKNYFKNAGYKKSTRVQTKL